MPYTIGNIVRIEWENVLRSLKTNLFGKTSKKSLFSLTVGFPIVNQACCVGTAGRLKGSL